MSLPLCPPTPSTLQLQVLVGKSKEILNMKPSQRSGKMQNCLSKLQTSPFESSPSIPTTPSPTTTTTTTSPSNPGVDAAKSGFRESALPVSRLRNSAYLSKSVMSLRLDLDYLDWFGMDALMFVCDLQVSSFFKLARVKIEPGIHFSEVNWPNSI